MEPDDVRPRQATRTPGRTPVVLVHGSRTSSTMWRAQVAALESDGRRVVAPDLPGHGRRRGETFTLDGAVDAVRAVADDVGAPVLLVGLSLGGYLGIEVRAREPGLVAGLVAASCCTVPSSPLRGAWLRAARRIEASADSGERLNRWMVDRTVPAAGRADLAAGGFALDTMAAILEAVGATDPLGSLARASSPVWLVNGRFDHFRLDERRFVEAARAGGAPVRHVVVPGAKHLVSLDRPVAFTRVLLEAAHLLDADGAGHGGDQGAGVRPGRSQLREPPTSAAELGTTTTSSPSRPSAVGVIARELPPPR
ncbi:pimeloyl-ACP methyl ester carboxylesterase [Sediminihabitans luteus]|uniref:Pimeloyl-ACP methyl ester carboxylesterase n=1 Tax=Sediminihabitans luteus TaxID=1138585 RepID=A0A2M9CZQ8_9CELL|nr:pimeloyl-ACP methyl ester carboxylesterase [Sediminihabitans luteus]